MSLRRTPRIIMPIFATAWLCAVWLAGCGTPIATDFPTAIRDADGNVITAEQVREIVDDPDLSEDRQRDALRELGIADEQLITALLEL